MNHLPSWRKYAGAAAGAALGGVTLNVPGALVGGYYGYKKGDEQDQIFAKEMDSGYGTRKRRASWSGNSNVKRVLPSIAGTSKGSGLVPRRLFYDRIGYKMVNGRGVRKTAGKRRPVKKRYKKPKGPKGPKGRKRKGKRTIAQSDGYYLSKGYHKTCETYGTISDPNCVYLAHSTGYLTEIGRTIANAILRKGLMKAGVKITNQLQEMPISKPIVGVNPAENSEGLKFIYTIKSTDGTYENIQFDTVDDENFYSMSIAFLGMQNHLIDYIRHTNTSQPFKFAVYKRDFGDVQQRWMLASEMYLPDCKLELGFCSTLIVQNKSAAATNGSGLENVLDSDRVDSQPLRGWVYDFKHADPRVKHQGPLQTLVLGQNNLFNSVLDIGMKLTNGNEFDHAVTTGPYSPTNISSVGASEPLHPKYFGNLAGAVQVTLAPGEMKKFNFKWDLKGRFGNVIRKLQVQVWNGVTPTSFTGMAGKCQMLALEEIMRTSSSNKISVGYERELKIGAAVTVALKQAPLETQVIHENYDRMG